MKSAADSVALRFGVRAPQGMRCMRLREGVLSPLLEDPPPSREGRSLLALLGGFLDALMVAAWSVTQAQVQHNRRVLPGMVLFCQVCSSRTASGHCLHRSSTLTENSPTGHDTDRLTD